MAGLNNRKQIGLKEVSSLATQPPKCPECASNRIWKDGLRKTENGSVQRYLCRGCGFRFSETSHPKIEVNISPKALESSNPREGGAGTPVLNGNFPSQNFSEPLSFQLGEDIGSHNASTVEKGLNILRFYNSNRQVCATAGEAKNLVKVETRNVKQAAGATTPDPTTIKGLIAQYAYWLEKEGYENTAYLKLLRVLARKGANLLDPENVKSQIACAPWKNGTKMLAVYAYDAMAKMLGIQWTPPKYIQEETLPFIPEEAELDALIAGCKSRRMAAYLQTLKETFADPSEALKLRWIDLDISNNTIIINHPVRGHRPRQLKASNRLIAMLNSLPKTSERIFPTTYSTILSCFEKLRLKAAQNLKNPRLQSISFTTFRHWGATMTYHYTRNLLLVQKLLGHKNIQNTLKYTQLVHFKDDEFDVATATTIEEAKELLAAGFDYITEKNDIMLFRRPKKFGSIGFKDQNGGLKPLTPVHSIWDRRLG